MIQFNWSFSDSSNYGELNFTKTEILNLNFRSFQQSEFCAVNSFSVCLSEMQYLHAEIK